MGEAGSTEKTKGWTVGALHVRIDLMQVKHTAGIVCQEAQGTPGQPQMLALTHEYNAHLGPLMLMVIVLQVDEAHGDTLRQGYRQAHRLVLEEVVGTLLDVLPEHMRRVRHRGIGAFPQAGIVLQQAHHLQVFGFHSP